MTSKKNDTSINKGDKGKGYSSHKSDSTSSNKPIIPMKIGSTEPTKNLSSRVEEFFKNLPSNSAKPQANLNIGEIVGRFGFRSALDVQNYLKTYIGRDVIHKIIAEKLAKIDALDKLAEYEKKLLEEKLLFLLLALLYNRTEAAQIRNKQREQEILAQNAKILSSGSNKSKSKDTQALKEELIREMAVYDTAIKELETLLVEQTEKLASLEEQQRSLEKQHEAITQYFEVAEQDIAKCNKFHERYKDLSFDDKVIKLTTKIEKLKSKSDVHAKTTAENVASNQDDPNIQAMLKEFDGINLKIALYEEIHEVYARKKKLYDAMGNLLEIDESVSGKDPASAFGKAHFVLKRDLKIEVYDGIRYLLRADESLEQLRNTNTQRINEAKKEFDDLSPQMSCVKNIVLQTKQTLLSQCLEQLGIIKTDIAMVRQEITWVTEQKGFLLNQKNEIQIALASLEPKTDDVQSITAIPSPRPTPKLSHRDSSKHLGTQKSNAYSKNQQLLAKLFAQLQNLEKRGIPPSQENVRQFQQSFIAVTGIPANEPPVKNIFDDIKPEQPIPGQTMARLKSYIPFTFQGGLGVGMEPSSKTVVGGGRNETKFNPSPLKKKPHEPYGGY